MRAQSVGQGEASSPPSDEGGGEALDGAVSPGSGSGFVQRQNLPGAALPLPLCPVDLERGDGHLPANHAHHL